MLKVVGILILIPAVLGYPRDQTIMPKEVKTMVENLEGAIASLNSSSTLEGENVQKRLRATTNNFHIYMQDILYFLNKYLDTISDSNTKKSLKHMIKTIEKSGYHLARNIGGDCTQLKTALLLAMQNLNTLFIPATDFFSKPQSELQAVVEIYDIALFYTYLVNLEIKHRAKPNHLIGAEIEIASNKLNAALSSEHVEMGMELFALSDFANYILDGIILQLERWYHLQKVKILQVVINELSESASSLRIHSRIGATQLDVQKSLVNYFKKVHNEVNKLSEMDNGENDCVKNVLFEYFALVSAVGEKLQLLLQSK